MAPFIVFGFVSQALLVGFFAAHLWRPADERRLGRLVYGMGLVALALGVAFVAQGQTWHLVLGLAAYAAWSALGAFIDIVRPIPWREPLRRSILIPFGAIGVAYPMGLGPAGHPALGGHAIGREGVVSCSSPGRPRHSRSHRRPLERSFADV